MKISILEAAHVRRTAPISVPVQESPAVEEKPGVLRDLLTVILLFVVLRGALFGFNYVGRSMTQMTNPTWCFTKFGYWDGWIRWDAGWYSSIVKKGYYLNGPDLKKTQSNVAFFPLFPYSIKAAIKLVGGRNNWYAGLFISNVATLFGLFYMFRIARRYLDAESARRSLVYLLLFPSSFFLSSYYSEGLFLLTTTASFYHFLGKRYFLCGVWGYLAALTRNPGVLLFPAFVLSLLWERRGKISRDDLPALWLLLIPCGLLTFMALLYHKVGDPLVFIHAHAAWKRKPTLPHLTLWEGFHSIDWSLPFDAGNMMQVLNFFSAIAFLVLPFFLLKGFDKSLAIYSLLVILMPLSSGAVYSMMRFELAAFPAFFVLARLGANRDVDWIIVSLSAMFLGLLNLGFTNWYFIV